MDKKEIIKLLKNIATLLEIKGENIFKIRAYTNAVDKILEDNLDISALVANNELSSVEGFGKALVDKLTEFIQTGKLNYYEKLINEVPEGLLEITEIPTIGPKKAAQLWKELNITNIEELGKACKDGTITSLKGFTEKTQEIILNYLNKK
jgi:DNA polymerase (family X)